jgi:hypothetical protein
MIRDTIENLEDYIVDEMRYCTFFDLRRREERLFYINTTSSKHNTLTFSDDIDCIGFGESLYRRKYCLIEFTQTEKDDESTIPQWTIQQYLNSILYREGLFDFRNKIGVIESNDTTTIKKAEMINVEIFEALKDIQEKFHLYLFIDEADGKINFYNYDNIDRENDFVYTFGKNIEEIKMNIDKNNYKGVIIRNQKGENAVYKAPDFKLGDNMYYYDYMENDGNLYTIAQRRYEEIDKDKINFIINPISLISENGDSFDLFNVEDLIGIRDNYLTHDIQYKKVKLIAYNPFNIYSNIDLQLVSEEDDLIKFVKNIDKENTKIKRTVKSSYEKLLEMHEKLRQT